MAAPPASGPHSGPPVVGCQNPRAANRNTRVGVEVVRRVLSLNSQGCGYRMTAAVLGAQGVSVSPTTVGRIVRARCCERSRNP